MDKIQCIGFSLPMFTALVCLIMLILFRSSKVNGSGGSGSGGNNDALQKRLVTLVIFTFAAVIFCWLGVILYIVDYNAFVWFNTVFFLAMMLDQVLLYHFIFSITGTGKKQKFNKIHYIIPAVLTLAMGIWSLLTPYEVQYYIVETRGEIAPEYEWFSRFFSAVVPIFIIYNIFYPLLGLLRIRAYRKEVVNYSADEQRTSLRWLYRFILLVWFTLPIASGVLFVHKSVFFTSLLTVPGAFLPIFQYLFICYNLMAGNYVIINPKEQDEDLNVRSTNIDIKRFEKYIKDKKPYLDSKLRITDMCKDLGTNRSYLSAFINNEYAMNFSRYINLQRLEELDLIRSMPENKNTKGIAMVLDAGFSSYRSYLRVKSQEDARRTVGF